MKKLVMAVTVAAMMTVSVLSVSAAAVEVEDDFVSRMDRATFLELRTAQLDAADITGEQYEALAAHIATAAKDGDFGNGSAYGRTGEVNEDCVLGEDGQSGIFRNENSGMKAGNGNGVGVKSQDGTNEGNGNRRGGQGNAAGNGLQDGSNGAQGARGQGNDGVCELTE